MIIEGSASGKLPPAASIVRPMTESGTPKVLPKECNWELLIFRYASIYYSNLFFVNFCIVVMFWFGF
jgi:hypothetical protein